MGELSFIERIESVIREENIILPVFSSIAMKVQQELGKKEPEVQRLINTISSDSSLVSQVLKIANSSFYKGLVEISTLQAAIVRLGIHEVGRISLSSSVKNQFYSKRKEHRTLMHKLWAHSIGCAMGARWLAKKSGLEGLESEVFFAALLHDTGKLFILTVVEQMISKDIGNKTTSFLLAEAMASLHSEQGYKLMKQWNLPERYCVVARDHHLVEFDEKNLILILVRLANMVCNKLGIGTEKNKEIVVSSCDEAQLLGISEIALAELEILLEDTKALAV